MDMMVELVKAGLATTKRERMVADGRQTGVVRVRITDAGRQALAKMSKCSKAPSLPSWRSRDLPGGRQADCSKGVAIQPSAVRRDVAESSSRELRKRRNLTFPRIVRVQGDRCSATARSLDGSRNAVRRERQL